MLQIASATAVALQDPEFVRVLEAAGLEADFMRAKVTTARFYADHILSQAPGVRDSIVDGADSVIAMALDAF